MGSFPPRILFIDAYDSFSNNIISLLEIELSCSVRTIKIDDAVLLESDTALQRELQCYDAVVCGPGPGSPENDKDVGIFKKIWRLNDDDILPVLGICLGFQSLCLEFGGKIRRLTGPQHGIVRDVTHIGADAAKSKGTIFEGVGVLKATHYQSLCADIGLGVASESRHTDRWSSSSACLDLMPLAYAESDLRVANLSGIMDEQVLVAVQHSSKPFSALQYHPESICTELESHKVIRNWFRQAQLWNQKHRRSRRTREEPIHGKHVVRPSLLCQSIGNPSTGFTAKPQETACYWEVTDLPLGVSVADLADEVCVGSKRIILESSNTNELLEGTVDVRGRFSIIALGVDSCPTFEYHVGNDRITKCDAGAVEYLQLNGASPWSYVAHLMSGHHATIGPEESPFWGGLMGFTTYELGLETINVASTKSRNTQRPDMSLAWISKNLVIDHRKSKIYIQQLGTMHEEEAIRLELHNMKGGLEKFCLAKSAPISSRSSDSDADCYDTPTPFSTPPLSLTSSQVDLLASRAQPSSHPRQKGFLQVEKPSDMDYESKVVNCQSYISAGDSYELCLTDQTTVTRSSPKSPSASWDLYLNLRARQPAPFASFINLGGATLVSSSPERFLTWDSSNHCSLRPMKGTVRKSPTVNTLEKATALLDVPKEKAENLMIVDLIRHDLHGICGSGNVQVPRLCVVEEYKSVYTMISVVEGQIPASDVAKEGTAHTGLDVLAASLPPGSMTGAPKKRSCEILQGIEGQERSLYSGVVGYVDVRGRGDWSVTIRSMFKWDDEHMVDDDGQRREKWHIGAGGAVTTLSTAVGEREEMCTKLGGTLGVFL